MRKRNYLYFFMRMLPNVEMRYSYLYVEKHIADKITSLCEKRDISKYRLSQFFQEGNSENLIEEQEEVLRIWNDLNINGQETVMSMLRGLRK